MHFFFQYDNEHPFVIDDEKQAWNLIKTSKNSNWNRKGLKYLGQSKGIIYKSKMAEIAEQKRTLKEKIDSQMKEISKYEGAFEKAKFEDLLEENDPKLLKFKNIIESKEKAIQETSKEIEELVRNVKREATIAELEEAKKNTTPPGDFTVEYGSLVDKNIPLSTIKSRL